MPKKKSSKGGSYAVGYGKPPVASQFKPGQSGNRRGRPVKMRPSLADQIPRGVSEIQRTVLLSCLTPFDDGEGAWVPSTNLGRIIDGQIEQAAAGDPRCARLIFEQLVEAKQAEQIYQQERMKELAMRYVQFMYTEQKLGEFRVLSDGRAGFGLADGTDEVGENGLEAFSGIRSSQGSS